MKTSRRGYAMAMLTGFAIIGASTAGVSIAQPQQQPQQLSSSADAQLPAPAVAPSTDPPVGAAPPSPDTSSTTSSASAATSTPAATPAGGGQSDTRAAAPATQSRSVQAESATSSTNATTREESSAPLPTSHATIPKTSAPISTSSAPVAPAAHKFKDGQYSATASYNSPGGSQQIGVTVTLTADKVTAAALDLKAEGIAKTYQTLFQSGYLPQVVGKDISTISLGAVAGSSLTGGGFNTALDQIEAQARG